MHNDLHPQNLMIKYCDDTPYGPVPAHGPFSAGPQKPLSQYKTFDYTICSLTDRDDCKSFSIPNLGFVVKVYHFPAWLAFTRGLFRPM